MAKIKLDSKNYRVHSDKNKMIIDKSLKELGAGRSILIDSENEIIAGNGVFEQAEKQNIKIKIVETDGTELIAVKRTDLKTGDKKRKKLALIDNHSTDTSNFDFEVINGDFEEVELEEWGVELEGIKEVLEAQEDDFDATPPEEPKTVLGDLYEIGEHRLLCGDSTQTDTFDKLMNGELADMVVTDPPYNVALGMETKEQAKARNRRTDGLVIQNDKMSNSDFYKFLYDFYSALSTAVKKGGSIYVWYASSEVVNFVSAMVDAVWLYKQELIWNKTSMIMGRQDYQWKHEPCLYGWLDGASHNWNSDRKQTTVIEYDKPQRNGERPTMKPIGLFAYQIENSSKVGDLVIDAFGGSGTTMVACEQLKRKARIVEYDHKYCDVIVRRMIKLDDTLTIKRNGVDVTNEWIN